MFSSRQQKNPGLRYISRVAARYFRRYEYSIPLIERIQYRISDNPLLTNRDAERNELTQTMIRDLKLDAESDRDRTGTRAPSATPWTLPLRMQTQFSY